MAPNRRRSSTSYLRYELLRTFRNRRFVFFSFGFPLVLFYLIAAPNRHEHDLGGSGLSAPLYYMVGLAAFGSMNAMLSTGARIAAERTIGWNRQLRITPLSTRAYFRAKVVTAYVMAFSTLALLFLAGRTLGVQLPAHDWVRMLGLIFVGLIPFAALGILIGHLVSAESVGPVIGGSTALLAFLGGTWFPITNHTLKDVAQVLPSYWLVQASHVATGGHGWGGTGWIVIGVWAGVSAALAARAYRRDTRRA
jgi:ABC-2 type transport system permease protein